jgi:TctA family transporter
MVCCDNNKCDAIRVTLLRVGGLIGGLGSAILMIVSAILAWRLNWILIFVSIVLVTYIWHIIVTIYYMSLQYRNKSKSQLTSPTPAQLPAVALSAGHIVSKVGVLRASHKIFNSEVRISSFPQRRLKLQLEPILTNYGFFSSSGHLEDAYVS